MGSRVNAQQLFRGGFRRVDVLQGVPKTGRDEAVLYRVQPARALRVRTAGVMLLAHWVRNIGSSHDFILAIR